MRGAVLLAAFACFHAAAHADDIDALWAAKKRFGPDVRGALSITRSGEGWQAEIAGWLAPVQQDGSQLRFELPPGEGSFRGRIVGRGIVGDWIQPPGMNLGMFFATPVRLAQVAPGRWRGDVEPVEDAITLFMPVRSGAAYLRNPERNAGRSIPMQRLVAEGGVAKAFGAEGKLLLEGKWDKARERLSLDLGDRGGWFDFHRATTADERAFLPRPSGQYTYRAPPAAGDGWRVGDAKDAGIDVAAIERFVQMVIDTPMDSLRSQQLHAVLIARHGKLVVEEYFHGTHRDEVHDTRSAAKVLTGLLAGAAGVPASTPVRPGITLRDLMTMSSGLDCDDGDDNSRGNEDRIQDEHPKEDWGKIAFALPVVRPAGQKAAYCSMSMHLAGTVIASTSGRWLPELFEERIAGPMQMRRYGLALAPEGEGYMGGGSRFTARDFLKLAQLMLDEGRWNGKQVVPAAWVRESLRPRFEMFDQRYGYQWWSVTYPYGDATVDAYFAGGNGSQISMLIPALDLAIVFLGGNYNMPAALVPQREYVPKSILPAVSRRKSPG